jgi:hypothetical protein
LLSNEQRIKKALFSAGNVHNEVPQLQKEYGIPKQKHVSPGEMPGIKG